ncbi:EF-hand domain-containing protein [Novosphingobium sp. ST904]|uniref:EF-hand domain-containing protein n=1 Tax=Novosphingobium sp. ST904 TaxID=1684385 RepID=UPI0006C88123|nr:EF-hand domain-containing protein [Novosphingobium sp. ST904]KPH57602.1 hypothetical protein ADT71_29215 [Novosphingobium sp. ST904]TCM43205.1 EF hand domain-containing protein [Novosphingobium sp. ST904]
MNRFRTITIGISAAALAIGGMAGAQNATTRPAAPSATSPAAPERDRIETRAEAQARAEAMFARLDVNKDGKLDRADREARRQQRREGMFDRLDTNRDGSISKAEFMADRGPDGDRGPRPGGDRPDGAGPGDMPPPPPGGPDMNGPDMNGPDMNGPGKDGRPERHGRHGGPRGGMKGPMMGLGKADADGDRAVTRAEFVTAALQRFDAVDTDKDGKITPEERRAARDRMRSEWQARKNDRRDARGAPDAPPPPAKK